MQLIHFQLRFPIGQLPTSLFPQASAFYSPTSLWKWPIWTLENKNVILCFVPWFTLSKVNIAFQNFFDLPLVYCLHRLYTSNYSLLTSSEILLKYSIRPNISRSLINLTQLRNQNEFSLPSINVTKTTSLIKVPIFLQLNLNFFFPFNDVECYI